MKALTETKRGADFGLSALLSTSRHGHLERGKVAAGHSWKQRPKEALAVLPEALLSLQRDFRTDGSRAPPDLPWLVLSPKQSQAPRSTDVLGAAITSQDCETLAGAPLGLPYPEALEQRGADKLPPRDAAAKPSGWACANCPRTSAKLHAEPHGGPPTPWHGPQDLGRAFPAGPRRERIQALESPFQSGNTLLFRRAGKSELSVEPTWVGVGPAVQGLNPAARPGLGGLPLAIAEYE